ncbi:hypothetical protein BDW60DRAFT_198751 [Aspergillus nidulans var. acristatus]
MFAIGCSSSGPIRFLLEGCLPRVEKQFWRESIVYSAMGDTNTNGNGLYPITGNIEAKDTNTKTLLHHAVSRNQPSLMKALLSRADPFPNDVFGKSPLSYAIEMHNGQALWPLLDLMVS